MLSRSRRESSFRGWSCQDRVTTRTGRHARARVEFGGIPGEGFELTFELRGRFLGKRAIKVKVIQ